jgi:uncharacterized protein with FMN-binding domain
MESKAPIFIGIAAVAIIGIALFSFSSNPSAPSQTASGGSQQAQVQPGTGENPVESTVANEYVDRVYESTGGYVSPAGPENVIISVTIADGIITATEFEGDATNEKSIMFQGQFESGYADMIIGQPIDAVQLDVVAGSSLTPNGFNEAIEQIKQQAQG